MSSKKIRHKKIIAEMPMQFQNPRDLKPDASIQHNVSRGNTPLKKIPFPKVQPTPGGPTNFQELLASERYREVVENFKRYTGAQVAGGDLWTLMQTMMGAFEQIMKTESRYRTQLQDLAVELVKKELAIPEGSIDFDARLVSISETGADFNRNDIPDIEPVDVDGEEEEADSEQPAGRPQQPPRPVQDDRKEEEEIPDLDEEQTKVEEQLFNRLSTLDLERAKRRFINALIQGASKRGHYMYHLVEERLREITGSDTLVQNYGIMMSINDLLYWMIPEPIADAMGARGMDNAGGSFDIDDVNFDDGDSDEQDVNGSNDYDNYDPDHEFEGGGGMTRQMANMMGVAGSEEVDRNREVPKVIAKAFCFPVLLHELVKGSMELIGAIGIPQDPELAQQVIGHEDTLRKEMWDLRLGPAIWKRFREQMPEEILTDEDKLEMQNYLLSEIFQLPAREFLRFAREVVSGSATGKRLMRELVDELVERLQQSDDEDYDYGESNFRRDLDSLTGDLDDEDEDDDLGWMKDLGISR
jgi:hypothetical protein